jgi:hypothetical protein
VCQEYRHGVGDNYGIITAITKMKKDFNSANQYKISLNFLSRKVVVMMLSAFTLMATACQKEEEVKPATEADKIEQVSRNLTAIKPITVQIPSDQKDGNTFN